MNRRNRTLIVVGLAVVLASLASYGVYRAIQQIPVREVTVVERQFVVATQRIQAGSTITAAMVRSQAWPADAPVAGGFATPEEVIGRGTTSLFVPNEPITEIKLSPLGSGAGLAPMIPEGMRAVSVRVNDIVGVSGFVTAGSRVDLIVTVRPGDDSVSRIILNNLEVLASGVFTDQATAREEGVARPASVVTVLVTPQDAEKLTLATNVGNIMLALRNPLDVEEVETRGVRTAALLAGPAPPPVSSTVNGRTRVTTPPPPPVVPPYTIQTIKGAEKSSTTVERRGAGGGASQGGGS